MAQQRRPREAPKQREHAEHDGTRHQGPAQPHTLDAPVRVPAIATDEQNVAPQSGLSSYLNHTDCGPLEQAQRDAELVRRLDDLGAKFERLRVDCEAHEWRREKQLAALKEGASDDRPVELIAADLRVWNALCRVLDVPTDLEARRELEAAKAEHDRLGESWAAELHERFARANAHESTAADAAQHMRTKDTKGLPKGRRSGAFVVTGAAPLVTDHVKLEAYKLVQKKLVKPGQVPRLDEQIEQLYRLGERYHTARRELEKARELAWKAAGELPERELDVDQRPLPVAAAAWRDGVRPCLDAADALEACARALAGLAGLERLAVLVTGAADALTSMMRVHGAEHARDSHAELHGAMRWMDAMRRLTTRERHASATSARSSIAGDARGGVLVALWDASDPNAAGAIGVEGIAGLTEPWSSAAWLGWCSAGRDESWSSTWDTWPMLDQFQAETVGAPRGANAAAVKQSRKRAKMRPAQGVKKSRSRKSAR